ncbi:MAG: tryptophan synthase subunit alpha [Actinomycetota bacterium]
MSRIEQAFRKPGSSKAFIPFITCGYPTVEGFERLFLALAGNGADIIEVGLPFSDPLADGPVIQKTSQVALSRGINADTMFESIKNLGRKVDTPVAVMSYFNPIYRYGVKRFLSACKRHGVSGLIIPDLPLEEFYAYKQLFEGMGVDNIMLASLTTGRERLKEISQIGKGFLYCVSVRGVTGQRQKIAEEVKNYLELVKEQTRLPAALGFGISTTEQINDIKDYTDGIIIGSKILSMVEENDFEHSLDKIAEFVREVKDCLEV